MNQQGDAMDYETFVRGKLAPSIPTGFDPDADWPWLFEFQRDLVAWAIRRGRAAIFANTGLGKTRMQLTWAAEVAQHTGRPVLVLAPLAVGAQTVEESKRIGISNVIHAREQTDSSAQIVVTNYERIHLFDPSAYAGVVLDESSIIKHYTSRTLAMLLEAFNEHPYRLACSATPAPNDWVELGTHAEFLGVCERREMMSEFFIQNRTFTKEWRLKGHARADFWVWVSSWGALVRDPSDLGYASEGYALPDLHVQDHVVDSGDAHLEAGMLFAGVQLGGLAERRRARKATLGARVAKAIELANSNDEPWIVWCDLNAESEALTEGIDGAVEVKGSDKPNEKESRLLGFAKGQHRVMVTKPKIAGFGLNWQHCRNVVFVGVTDSWEAYYQAVRRCWRFGQAEAVKVHVITSDLEGEVLQNLRRKDQQARELAEQLAAESSSAIRAAIIGQARTRNAYQPSEEIQFPVWLESDGPSDPPNPIRFGLSFGQTINEGNDTQAMDLPAWIGGIK